LSATKNASKRLKIRPTFENLLQGVATFFVFFPMAPPFSTGHVTKGQPMKAKLNLCLLFLSSAMINAQAPEIWAPSTLTATR
jgi:hypothetical protein